MNFYELKKGLIEFLTDPNGNVRFLGEHEGPEKYGCKKGLTNIIKVNEFRKKMLKFNIYFEYKGNFCCAFVHGRSKDIYAIKDDIKMSFDNALSVAYIFLRDPDGKIMVFNRLIPNGRVAEKQSDLKKIVKEIHEKYPDYYCEQLVGDFSICNYFGDSVVVGGKMIAKRYDQSVLIFNKSFSCIANDIFKVLKMEETALSRTAQKAAAIFDKVEIAPNDFAKFIPSPNPKLYDYPLTFSYGSPGFFDYFDDHSEKVEALKEIIGIDPRRLKTVSFAVPQDFEDQLILHGFDILCFLNPDETKEVLEIKKTWVGVIDKKMTMKIYDPVLFRELPENSRIKQTKVVFLNVPTDKASKSFSLYEAFINTDADLCVNNIRGFTNTSGTALEKIVKMNVPHFSRFIMDLSKRKICVKGKKKKDHLMGMSTAQIRLMDKVLSTKITDAIEEFVENKNDMEKIKKDYPHKLEDTIIEDLFLKIISEINLSDVDTDTFEDILKFALLRKSGDYYSHFDPHKISGDHGIIDKLARFAGTKKTFLIQDFKTNLKFFFKHKDEIKKVLKGFDADYPYGFKVSDEKIVKFMFFADGVKTEKDVDKLAENFATRTNFNIRDLTSSWGRLFEYIKTSNLQVDPDFLKELREKSAESVTDMYRDYILTAMSISDLGYDKPIPISIAYHNVKREHDAMRVYHSWLTNHVEAEKFKKAVSKYKDKYEYESEDFIIIAPQSPSDLVHEGIELGHCVGSYVQSVATGKSNILFVRRKNNSDKPFATMEIKGDRIHQLYGFGNTIITEPDFIMFIEEYRKVKKIS